MARRERCFDDLAKACLQLSVQHPAFAQHDKKGHPAFTPEVFEIDDKAVEHLGQGLDGAVQLGRAHADAVAIDGGV